MFWYSYLDLYFYYNMSTISLLHFFQKYFKKWFFKPVSWDFLLYCSFSSQLLSCLKWHIAGGTFALYSLLCSHTNIGILPSKRTGADLSHSNQLMRNESQSRLGKFLEHSITARRIVLFIAMLGVCMLIGDGILTPAISGTLLHTILCCICICW